MTLRLSIIVPAFNEAHRLADGMRRFDAAVADGAVNVDTTELLVVDDGSTDSTAVTAAKLLAPFPHHRVVSLEANQGKGAAVRAGVSLARGDFTAYMDADMAIDPHAIPLLLDGLESSDLAIGSRALTDSMVDGSYALRAVMGRLFNRLVTGGTGLGLLDTQCGFKAFRTPAARLLFDLVRIDRFAFDVEILVRARRLGLRITEVPVHWKHVAGSTIHPLHDSVSMLADVCRSRLGLLPNPPVAALVVHRLRATTPSGDGAGDRVDGSDGSGDGSGDLADRVGAAVTGALDGAPVPIVDNGSSITVLLALVGPAERTTVLSVLRAELDPLEVTRRDMTLDLLTRIGPMAGRLRAPSAPGGAR